jgi:hypothetical protein
VVREIWYLGGPNPDHVVDITETYAVKPGAVKRHASQTSHLELDTLLRDRTAMTARTGVLPEGRLAEAFNVFRTEPAGRPSFCRRMPHS